MESQISWLWGVISLIFTICATGFFFLARRLNELSDSIVTAKSFVKKIDSICKDLHEIKNALLGTYERKGLITKVAEIENKLEEVK